ncbi:MAG TPA: DoxX family protein, partial [Propionibacterium sp.]|nr:DoxX family protein [Propionibacterium sp.]
LVVQQGMVIAWTKWFHGPWLENSGYEYNVIQAALALVLVTFGAGRIAIDRLFRRSRNANDPLLDDDFGTTRSGATRDDSGPA